MPDDMVDAHIHGVTNALAAGWRVLERGGAALDAVEEAVVIMEDDETFDAGRGSFLNRDGKVQLDALIMDGATLRAGGVGCVERLRNPVRAARKILSESPHVYFVGEGAEKFAAQHGIPLCQNEDLVIPREVERLRDYQAEAARRPPSQHGNDLFAPSSDDVTISHDTVGAVALDRNGNIAAATSTGGTLNKAPGRSSRHAAARPGRPRASAGLGGRAGHGSGLPVAVSRGAPAFRAVATGGRDPVRCGPGVRGADVRAVGDRRRLVIAAGGDRRGAGRDRGSRWRTKLLWVALENVGFFALLISYVVWLAVQVPKYRRSDGERGCSSNGSTAARSSSSHA